MIDKQTLNRLAAEAGFGANQRTTLLVKLTKFAELVERHTRNNELRIPEEYSALYEGGDDEISGMMEAGENPFCP